MKKAFIALLTSLITIFALVAGCSTNNLPPKLEIISGGKEVPSTVKLIHWGSSKKNSVNALSQLLSSNSADSLPTAPNEGEIELRFSGAAPDFAILSDQIINADGSPMYSGEQENSISIVFMGDKATFKLPTGLAPVNSPVNSENKEEIIIRGFRLLCIWGENECEYAFAIRSDANLVIGSSPMPYNTITAEQAYDIMSKPETYAIIDVRTDEEFAEGHIKGAKLIPDSEIAQRAASELPDKDELILLYCRSGRRSALSAQILADMGYTRVNDFGGIIDWPYETVME